MNYTEQNQKAEFYGGAIAGLGCLIFGGGFILFLIVAYVLGSK
jgi:hypothetical protein